MGANELDVVVGHGALGVALVIGLEVAEVTNVALVVGGSTVGLAMRVDLGNMSVLEVSGQKERKDD